MGFSMIRIIIGVFVSTATLLASDMQQPVFGKGLSVGEIWTASDMWELAKTKQVAAAVSSVASAWYEPGSPVPHQVERIREAIDATTEESIRNALLKQADGGGDRKKDSLGAFARTVDASATCGTSGTAGGDGLDLCADRCERGPDAWTTNIPRRRGCYLLCSLAVAPCANELFSWDKFSNNWVTPTTSLMTSVKNRVAVQVETMTPEINRMLVGVKTVAILAHGKGIEMARDVAASKAVAGLCLLIFDAVDALQTPRALKIMFLLLVGYAYGHYAQGACRVARQNTCEMEKREKAAQEELKGLKLRQLVKIKESLVKHDGFYALHGFAAWQIHRESVKAAKAECVKVGFQLLEGLVRGRMKRAMATRLVRWQMSASSEASAKDEED